MITMACTRTLVLLLLLHLLERRGTKYTRQVGMTIGELNAVDGVAVGDGSESA